MKKLLSILLLVLFIGINQTHINASLDKYINAMGTTIVVELYDQGTEEDYLKIKEIFEYYDYLGSNYIRKDSPYQDLNNVYIINEQRNKAPVLVNDDLFELISFSIDMMQQTNGYFNPLIGEAVDIWKNVIETYEKSEITEAIYNQTKSALEAIPSINASDIILDRENKTILLTGNAKLDLGAVAKGYATQKAVEYIQSKGIKMYQIDAGKSSLAYGTHPQNRPFNVGLNDPLGLYEPVDGHLVYAIIKVKDKHVVTSGDSLQYVTYQGKTLHHILDPHDYMPKNYYHTITIQGLDGAQLDAYSTAVFNMPEDVAIEFLEGQGLNYSFYKTSGITHNYKENDISLSKPKKTYNSLLILVLILSSVILVFGSVIAVMMIKEKKQKDEQKTAH